MHRVLSSISVVVVAGLAAAAVVACNPLAHGGDQPIVVLYDEAPPVGGSACMFTATGTEPAYATGDVNADSSVYYLHPLMQSEIAGLSTGSGSAAGQSRTIFTTGAHVHIDIAGASKPALANLALTSADTDFDSLFSIPIEPGGFAVAPEVNVVSPGVMGSILAAFNAGNAGNDDYVQLQTTSIVYGNLGADTNSEVDSAPFNFPIRVHPTKADVLGPCPQSPDTSAGTDPCNAFQDGPLQCCSEQVCGDNSLCVIAVPCDDNSVCTASKCMDGTACANAVECGDGTTCQNALVCPTVAPSS